MSSSPSQDKPRTSSDSNRRQSTSSSSGMFANLSQYKRNPDSDKYQQRRASINDQSAQKPGVLGQMFDKFVRGEHPANK